MKDQTKGTLIAAASGIIFGISPVASKFVYAYGVAPVMVLFFRGVAIPVLYCIAKLFGESLRITKQEFWKLLVIALLAGVITPLCLQVAYSMIAAGTAITIHYLYCVFILIGCVVFYREKFDWLKATCIGICVVGVYLLYLPSEVGSILGMGIALFSAVTYAAYSVFLDKSGMNRLSPVKVQFYVNVISWICVSVIGFSTRQIRFNLDFTTYLVLILYHGFGMIAAAMLYQIGVRYVGSQRTAILSTFEPMTGVLLGILLFREAFNFRIAVGIICILAAAVIITATRGRRIAAVPNKKHTEGA